MKKRKCLALLLTFAMVIGMMPSFAIAASAEESHTHTESCYAQAGDLLCDIPESEGHVHSEDCKCPGGEYICGQIESEGHVHDESCYEYDDENASPSNASSPKLICAEEESEGHTHTEECVCPGGELICDLEESEGHMHGEDCYAKGGELICGEEDATTFSSDQDYDDIKAILTQDDSISFDPDTQTFVVVDINATTADNVTRLINKGLLDEQAMKTAMDWSYYMKVSINSEDVTETKDFYIYDGETISKGSKEAYNNSTTSMQMVPADKGKNIIIINKGDSCTVTPDSRAFFWGTDHSSTNPVPNKYGYECDSAYAAPNPVNTEDFTGRGCSDIQDGTTLDFSYEWNLYNWMEIETWFINEQEKSINFSTDNIPTDAASPVDYLIELRDDEGNISRIPVTIYEDYGSGDFVMMKQPGVVHQYAERDNYDLWTEGGVRIPAGYDFRIRALNNDQPIGVYVGGSEQLKSPGWDEEGFREAAEDLGAGQYIVEEYFMIPKDEIRIEKIATNAPADEEFVFTATKNYPYYNWVTYEKTETVQMPLNNYPYTLYSSADNTKIGNYKTSDTGNFTLKNGQYAIFKVWKNPDDFLDYEDNGSTYWEGYKKWKEKGDPMPDSSVYTFREQEIPDCVTTVEHVTKDGTNTVKGTYVDNVNNGDSLVFRNAFQDTSAASGSLTISKKATGTGTPDADTLFEFTVTKDKTAAVGQYSVDGGTVQTISADGKISLKAGQSAVLTGLEPGEYTVTETSPIQANYKSTSFSVNNGEVQNGLSATVTVTGATAAAGGWSKKDGMPVQDADGYFTYTITSDQIDADGKITVDCDLLAEYIEAQMQKYQNLSVRNFKVKFVNQTGAPIQYQDYRFDTVNWIPVGETYTPSDTPSMENQYGYGWGDVWKRVYPFVAGQTQTAGSLNVKGFDGNNIRLAISPLRCINPAVISYFDSNSGKDKNLTGNNSLNSAGYITLKQMNALPELIKKAFTFKNWEGTEISLPADTNRTYADFICAFYGVNSLNDLTIAQKYNVLGTGGKGSPSLQESKYKGQSAITTYYSIVAPMTNRYIPIRDLGDNTLNYFKTWGFGKVSGEEGYAYNPDFFLMENDPEVLKMAYDFLYSRCIRFSLDSNDRPVSTSIDNSATSDDGVGGIKDYMDRTDAATANVLKTMNNGAAIADGSSVTLDNVEGYIEVPNAWNQFRAYDFGFKLIFKADAQQPAAASVTFTNTYENNESVPGEKVGNLTVSKTISGNGASSTKAFTFTVTLTDKNGQAVSGTFGDAVFDKNGQHIFTLKAGENKTISSIPTGTKYAVAESDNSGYTVTVNNTADVAATGTIMAGETAVAAFNNYKSGGGGGGETSDPSPAKVNLTATKTLDGKAPSGSAFSFVLKDKDGNIVQTKNNQEGSIAFDSLSFSAAGTYTYYIAEQAGTDANINYDATSYKVTITVTRSGDYKAAVSYEKNGQAYDGIPVFVNTTKADDSDKPNTPTTPDKPNTPVTPDKPNTPTTPDKPAKPTDPAQPIDPVPQTGDETDIGMWLTLMLCSFVALVGVCVYERKRRYSGRHVRR